MKAVKLNHQKKCDGRNVAEMQDIHPVILSRWRQDFSEGRLVNDGRVKITSIQDEKVSLHRVSRLEKENACLKQENKLLKKWHGFSGNIII